MFEHMMKLRRALRTKAALDSSELQVLLYYTYSIYLSLSLSLSIYIYIYTYHDTYSTHGIGPSGAPGLGRKGAPKQSIW